MSGSSWLRGTQALCCGGGKDCPGLAGGDVVAPGSRSLPRRSCPTAHLMCMRFSSMLQGVWGVTGTGIPCFCREKHSASLWGEPASATGTGPGGLSPKITKAQPPRQWQCSCASDCAPSAPRSMGTSGTRCPNPTACCQEGNGCPSPTTRRDGAPGHPLTEVMEMSAICAFFFSPRSTQTRSPGRAPQRQEVTWGHISSTAGCSPAFNSTDPLLGGDNTRVPTASCQHTAWHTSPNPRAPGSHRPGTAVPCTSCLPGAAHSTEPSSLTRSAAHSIIP